MIDNVELTYDDVTGSCELFVSGDEDDVSKVETFALNMMDDEEDMVNHPLHYTKSGIECIHEMIILYGREETMSFCKLNAHKYRRRAMYKGGEEDLAKSDWYIKMYAILSAMRDYEAVEWVKSLYKDYLTV